MVGKWLIIVMFYWEGLSKASQRQIISSGDVYWPVPMVLFLVYRSTEIVIVPAFVVVVQSLSCIRLFATSWTATHQPSPSPRACSDLYPLSQWCHPTISSSIVSFSSCLIFLSIGVFSSESALCIRWPKYWSFSFSSVLPVDIQDWFPFGLTDLISLQPNGLSKSFLQHCSLKGSVLWCSFFMVQFWHLYMTTGKTIALTIPTFVSKVMFLLFSMLTRFVIAFLLGSKHLLISWLQSPSSVILEPKKIKFFMVSALGELKMQSKIWPCMYEYVKFHLQCTYFNLIQSQLNP